MSTLAIIAVALTGLAVLKPTERQIERSKRARSARGRGRRGRRIAIRELGLLRR